MKQLIVITFLFVLVSFQTRSQTLVDEAEAESGVLTGVAIANQTGSSSGNYVTGFDNDGDKVTVIMSVPTSGMYQLVVRYRATLGAKVQDLYVNDVFTANLNFSSSSDFTDLETGKIWLTTGNNTLAIQKNWGYMDVDKFSLYTTIPNNYDNITTSLIDPLATTSTKQLYAFLTSQFTKRTISGQTDEKYADVKTLTGKSPLLRAYDLLTYSPEYPYNWDNGGFAFGPVDNGTVESAINWYNSTDKKGVVSFHWHWYSPSGGTVGTNTFYTTYTTFDVSQAVINGTQENTEILRDIDAIAVQLKKLRDADVPVLWRPLHEASGGWFWWGAKGSSPCLALYDILFDRITNYHGIHNLIWVWSTPESDWYPGNEKVDVIGYDSYPGEYNYITQKNVFDQLYNVVQGQKLIAMSENGPIPDVELCFAQDAPWLYYMSWNQLVFDQNSNEHINDVYKSPYVVTLENIADPAPEGPPVIPVVTSTAVSPETEVSVYPNPFKDNLVIPDVIWAQHPRKVTLYNMHGVMIWESATFNQSIPLEGISKGVYILKISLQDEVLNFKIVKE